LSGEKRPQLKLVLYTPSTQDTIRPEAHMCK
jgi:hypothetical protein